MLKKMWVRLFLQMAAIILVFVAVLSLANSTFMTEYYIYKEKANMQEVAKRIDEVKLYSNTAAAELSAVISETGYSLNITDSFGNGLFSSFDAPVADYKGEFMPKSNSFKNENVAEGFVLISRQGKQHLMYTHFLSGGEVLTLSIQREIMENSAEIANEFILIVATCCLVFALLWVFF